MLKRNRQRTIHLLNEYGMILVLVLLGLFFSVMTLTEQYPSGKKAGLQLAQRIQSSLSNDASILIASRNLPLDITFAETLHESLDQYGFKNLHTVVGEPRDARAKLLDMEQAGTTLEAIAGNQTTSKWLVFADIQSDFPGLKTPLLLGPTTYRWPNFLKRDNLLNITNQIVVIAMVAIGMTVVIIAGGIDLSVGSLIAFSAVSGCLFIRNFAGALEASFLGMVLACIGAITLSGFVGAFTGGLVTAFSIPPFIVTLSMMMMASGTAYLLSGGESIYQVPDTFVQLGRGSSVLGVPNAVMMMLVLYVFAHVMMSQTKLGRYIYAVGGNPEAARLSGVPVRRVQLFAYTLSGALAGLGGIVMASQLKSGSPTYGQMYELYVIAAVVVGGTSLSGGEGKVFGTLIGAFIIAVIQNGMNLMNIESYTQKVILGFVILVAVMLDKIKQKGFSPS
ncbi:MAG: ABC transporter permease [Verrucomicrobiota bacterium]|jgi:ribose transport system permease protein|nr:ABC transporter permease [Verrucomicrobiota bacterium]